MVRSEYKYHTLEGLGVFDFAQQKRNGREGEWAGIPLSAGEAPDEEHWQGRRHSPVVAARERERERERGVAAWERRKEGRSCCLFRATGRPQVGRPTRSPKTKRAAWQVCVQCPPFLFPFFLFCSSALLKFLGMDFQNIKII